jgi:hypothetical protein
VKSNKTGLVLFWIGVILILGMGLGGSWVVRPIYRNMTLDQANATIWGLTSPLFGLWASSVPIGSILAGVGLLLYVRAKRATIWLFGVGSIALFMVDTLTKFRILPPLPHISSLFGIGGGLILVFFLTSMWLWGKKRSSLDESARSAADLQLVGYVFLAIAMWYLCGDLSRPYQKALLELPQGSPIMVIVYLVLGWLFTLLSQYKSIKYMKEKETQNG